MVEVQKNAAEHYSFNLRNSVVARRHAEIIISSDTPKETRVSPLSSSGAASSFSVVLSLTQT